jgi:LmbE family N-acetylglucosaminyl deacetylase
MMSFRPAVHWRYAVSGANVTLVCVTRGEAGEISDPALATPETLAEVRTQELVTAAKALARAPIFIPTIGPACRE